MTDITQIAAAPELGLLRLRTLVRLRWLAVIGQAMAVLLVQFYLGFKLPLSACLGLIALSAWLNVFLNLRWRGNQRLSAQPAGLLLGYDVLQLAALLFLTGGLQNPFALLFLVPVTVSATSLPIRWTASLGAIGLACASILAFYHWPLPWSANLPLNIPPIYVFGMWVAIVSATVFSAIYARRIAEEARVMSSALQATELVLAREQRLSALDGLAAAAAHELGTPLATIALVAKELKRELPKNFAHGEDIDLLISQAARCREILTRLAVPEQLSDDLYFNVGLEAMLEDMVAPLRGSDVVISVDAQSADLKKPEPAPTFKRNPAITYGLGNILENAIDFAKSRVDIKARWSTTQVSLTVADDGPGFDQTIFDQLGDPFVTTRPGYGDAEPGEPGQHEGMGLGLFIAKTLLERSGASVTLANRKVPEQGAIIQISWPRVSVDVAKKLDPQAKQEQKKNMNTTPKTLLLVDDDKPFLTRLGKAMETRGFVVRMADTVAEGIAEVKKEAPFYAVVDLRLADGNGLDVIEVLHAAKPEARVVVLTGYGNIATAVTAVKMGAIDYLAKPADADAVYGALTGDKEHRNALPDNPMSADRVRWEHIQRVFELCNRNVSETARRLNMHRRTLQRILAKRAPK